MMKKTTTLLLLSAIVYSLTSFRVAPPHTIRPRQKAALHTIIIDPGHGGIDNGTHGLFSKEKDVNLAISLKLGKAIQAAFPDIKVIYTRTTDILPGNMPTVKTALHYRADLANRSKGDLFLCIHANATRQPPGRYQVHEVTGHKYIGKGRRRRKVPIYKSYWVKNTTTGTVTFIWKAMWGEFKGSVINDMADEDMGDSTASTIDQSSPEARMRAQLYEKKYFANSAYLASLIQNEFVNAGRKSDGVQQRDVGLWVLEATGMPSVLVETGYLTNNEEEEYLNSKEGQGEVVNNIIEALKRYKGSLEGHTDAGGAGAGAGTPGRMAR